MKLKLHVCLEEGERMKMLKRHLITEHGMTPGRPSHRLGPAADYPMVAPEQAETRRDLAVKISLGGKPGQKRGHQAKPAPQSVARGSCDGALKTAAYRSSLTKSRQSATGPSAAINR